VGYLLETEDDVDSFLYDEERVCAKLYNKLYDFMTDRLVNGGDDVINDPALRVAPESHTVRLEYVVVDPERNGALRVFRFFVNTASAVFGVLRVVYIDEF